MPELCYTLTDKSVSSIDLAKWVRDRMGDELMLNECLVIARALQRGETWRPPYYAVRDRDVVGPCAMTTTYPDDPHREARRLSEEREQAIWGLQRKGATGDAEAAIAFCKAITDGELHIYGPAYA